MHRELPELKRCCFCLPLRRGLIAWGYTKVCLNMFMVSYTTFFFYVMVSFSSRLDGKQIGFFTLIIVCLLIDTVFNIIFIAAGHTKSIRLMKVSNVYNMVWLGVLTLAVCCILYENIYFTYVLWSYIDDHEFLVIDFIAGTGFVSIIFVQVYVILLTRSELTKLRQQSLEMQFTNHAGGQCTTHSAADQCTDKKDLQDC